MRTHLKRLLRVGLVGLVALVFVGPAPFVGPTSAQAAGPPFHFDEGDLNGVYAGLLTGNFNVPAAASLARIVADGAGNLTLEPVRSVGGATQCTGARPCTYSIQPSGFGTISCAPFTPSSPCVGGNNAVIVHILLSDGGQQFDLFLEGTNIAGHLIRQ